MYKTQKKRCWNALFPEGSNNCLFRFYHDSTSTLIIQVISRAEKKKEFHFAASVFPYYFELGKKEKNSESSLANYSVCHLLTKYYSLRLQQEVHV